MGISSGKSTCPVCGNYMVYIGRGATRVCEECGFKGHAVSHQVYADAKKKTRIYDYESHESHEEKELRCVECGKRLRNLMGGDGDGI